MQFLIIDGYPKSKRDEFDNFDVKHAYKMYADILTKYLPGAKYDVLHPMDPGHKFPEGAALENYTGIILTGCSCTVYHCHISEIQAQVDLQKKIFELGIPSIGSCWGLQMAAFAAGGEVKINPRGREMGIGRKIRLTNAGKSHPFMEGKPEVFDHFESHDDEVTKLPPNSVVLASNDHSYIQAAEIKFKKGTFWATQYHPEYNLYDMARLILAREEKLIQGGFFKTREDLIQYSKDMETLAKNHSRTDLAWKLGIDKHILDDKIREQDFANWIKYQIKA